MSRWIFAIFCALAVRAQDVSPQYDFLLIVDNSISMAERKPEVLTAVRDTIRSGFAGQIQEGDAIEIWTLDQSAAPFRVDPWDPKKGGEITSSAGAFLATQKFHRGSHLGPALARLDSYLETNRNSLVVLLTDGEEPISGLRFDADLNRDIAKRRREASRLKRPILIALTAVDGKLTDWLMKIGTEQPALARLPERAKPIVAAAPKPEPIVEPEPPKAPEPEPPRIFDLPPGAKLGFAVVSKPPANAASESTTDPTQNKVNGRNENSESDKQALSIQSLMASHHQNTDSLNDKDQRSQAPGSNAAVVVNQQPPVPQVKTSSTPGLLGLELMVLTNAVTPPGEANTKPGSALNDSAVRAASAESGRISSRLNWVYLMGIFGGASLASTGLILLRRPSATRRESIISKSLAK